MSTQALVITIAALVVIAAVVLGLVLRSRHAQTREPAPGSLDRPPRDAFRKNGIAEQRLRRAAVITDPGQPGLAEARELLARVSEELGWAAPLWLETGDTTESVVEPAGAERLIEAALAEQVDVICSLGSDATVRGLAGSLAGRGTPLGLLPAAGAGALHRSLGLPLDDLEAAYRIACTGRNRRIDVGRVQLGGTRIDDKGRVKESRPEGSDGEFLYLATAAFGGRGSATPTASQRLDAVRESAELPRSTADLRVPSFVGFVHFPGHPEVRRRLRKVVVGNCAPLLGDDPTRPVDRLDDGTFDVVLVGPTGVRALAPLTKRALDRGAAVLGAAMPGKGAVGRGDDASEAFGARVDEQVEGRPVQTRPTNPLLDHEVTHEVRVRSVDPRPVEVDEVVVGEAREIVATVRPRALTVRVHR